MTGTRSFASRRVFVDTSAYVALALSSETDHADAQAIAKQLMSERRPLFTTNFILAETHALFLARAGREVALRALDQIESSTTTVVRVSAADEQRARAVLRRYDDKHFSLTDATSFAVMERLRMREAFTFDRHFEQYGFIVLRAR